MKEVLKLEMKEEGVVGEGAGGLRIKRVGESQTDREADNPIGRQRERAS